MQTTEPWCHSSIWCWTSSFSGWFGLSFICVLRSLLSLQSLRCLCYVPMGSPGQWALSWILVWVFPLTGNLKFVVFCLLVNTGGPVWPYLRSSCFYVFWEERNWDPGCYHYPPGAAVPEAAVVVQPLTCVWLFVTHGPQHATLSCPSLSAGTRSESCPSSRWCHPTISSSVVPFSFCLQSFPASGSFPMSQFFTSGGQSIGVSASASVNIPVNIQDWFPSGLTDLQSKGLSRVFSSTPVCFLKWRFSDPRSGDSDSVGVGWSESYVD